MIIYTLYFEGFYRENLAVNAELKEYLYEKYTEIF